MTASQATALWSALVEELTDLQAALIAAEKVWASQIELVDPENHASAVNLAHYWVLRQYDLRDLQGRLAELGLSSLSDILTRMAAHQNNKTSLLRRLRSWQPTAPA